MRSSCQFVACAGEETKRLRPAPSSALGASISLGMEIIAKRGTARGLIGTWLSLPGYIFPVAGSIGQSGEDWAGAIGGVIGGQSSLKSPKAPGVQLPVAPGQPRSAREGTTVLN